MKKCFLLIICMSVLLSVSSDTQKKYIRAGDYDIVCFVSLKDIKNHKEGLEYFWFKSGEIHSSVSNTGGVVLHDSYSKFFRTKQLAEKGTFNFGLKDGQWRTWYENGNLNAITDWKKGLKNGIFITYDQEGQMIESGTYSNHRKSNTWINHKLKDTLYYKGDSTYTVKPVSKVNGIFNKIFRKRDSTEKVQIKSERQLKRTTDSIKRAKRKKARAEAKAKKEMQSDN